MDTESNKEAVRRILNPVKHLKLTLESWKRNEGKR